MPFTCNLDCTFLMQLQKEPEVFGLGPEDEQTKLGLIYIEISGLRTSHHRETFYASAFFRRYYQLGIGPQLRSTRTLLL